MKTRTATLTSWIDSLQFLLIWGFLAFLCGLAAFAIHDYEQLRNGQLERVHTAGMGIGSAMCGRSQ